MFAYVKMEFVLLAPNLWKEVDSMFALGSFYYGRLLATYLFSDVHISLHKAIKYCVSSWFVVVACVV